MSWFKEVSEEEGKKFTGNWLGKIIKEMVKGYSILDIGCGDGRTFNPNSGIYIGIDNNDRIFTYKPNTTKFLMKYDFSNGLIPFLDKNFDIVLLIDVIEHLEKDKAMILLKEAERIAKKKIIIYTPDGFLEQNEEEGKKRDVNFDKFDIHRCGFDKQELENMGYIILVFSGDNVHNRKYDALLGVKDV
jgi:SAM-dependent methyltransferase